LQSLQTTDNYWCSAAQRYSPSKNLFRQLMPWNDTNLHFFSSQPDTSLHCKTKDIYGANARVPTGFLQQRSLTFPVMV